MKHTYGVGERRVSVDLIDITQHEWLGERAQETFPTDGSPVFLVTRIEVGPENRHKGYAREAVQALLDDADAEGAWLVLTCDPDGSSGALGFVDLWAWYERLGFAKLHDDIPDMYRRPKSCNP